MCSNKAMIFSKSSCPYCAKVLVYVWCSSMLIYLLIYLFVYLLIRSFFFNVFC